MWNKEIYVCGMMACLAAILCLAQSSGMQSGSAEQMTATEFALRSDKGLVLCPRKTCTKSGEFLMDGIGGGSPEERAGAAVVMLHEFIDASDQFADAAKATAADGLLGDEAKPAFNLVEP